MSKSKVIIFVRHGQSQTNATDIFQSGDQVTTDPLTDHGIHAARALADRLAKLHVDTILSSSYLRARQTAGLINEKLNVPHLVPVLDRKKIIDMDPNDPHLSDHVSLLREIDLPSELKGLHFRDKKADAIRKTMKRTHALRRKVLPLRSHFSDEENIYDVWDRALTITKYLEARPESSIVVVAHGGILKVWLASILFGQETEIQDRMIRVAILKGYTRFVQRSWWDNTGFLTVLYDEEEGWRVPIANVNHLNPLIPNVLGNGIRARRDRPADDEAKEYLE